MVALRCFDVFRCSPGGLQAAAVEMLSNRRSRMFEAAEREDVYSAFMSLASLQRMPEDIASYIG